jgi:integrase
MTSNPPRDHEPTKGVGGVRPAHQTPTRTASTLRAYRSDWADFAAWCEAHGVESLPASTDTTCRYLNDLAAQGRRPATLQRRVSSIAEAHQAADFASPTADMTLRSLLQAIRHRFVDVPSQVVSLTVEELHRLVDAAGGDLRGLRDRALLLLGFATGLRRSDLVSLDVEDIRETGEGLLVHLKGSKTEQEAPSRRIGVLRGSDLATCPVRAVIRWLEAANLGEGPLFRPVSMVTGQLGADRLCDRNVARVVQRCAKRAGLDPSRYSAKSLRSGSAIRAATAVRMDRQAILRQMGVPESSLPW